MAKILITGGSGLLGKSITEKLLAKGHEVSFLSTRKNYTYNNVSIFYWNIEEAYIDETAFENVDAIIHLAGTSVAGKRWTNKRKKDILDSRVNSSNLLLKYLKETKNKVKTFIGASAIGIYGGETEGVLKEDAPIGNDFLAHVCKEWEKAYQLSDEYRKVVFRIGIVLTKKDGALGEMMKTLPFFVGVLSNGKQTYSWIHEEDLANAFVFAVENNQINGAYNIVSPNTCSQKTIAKEIANNKKSFTLPTPAFSLQLVLGEMSQVVLMSQNCSAQKLINDGFQFSFPTIKGAIKNLLE